MSAGFNIYRKLENGHSLQVAWRRDRSLAEKLAKDLNENFPGEYGIEPAASEPVRCVPYAPAKGWSN
jgi:hypothetical protein